MVIFALSIAIDLDLIQSEHHMSYFFVDFVDVPLYICFIQSHVPYLGLGLTRTHVIMKDNDIKAVVFSRIASALTENK